jgi:hypothetical protein
MEGRLCTENYEDFQIKASTFWIDKLTGEFEMLFLTFQQLRIFGYDIAAMTPFTCPKDHSDLQDGLCYVPCKKGYHGVGPVCWVDSTNIGIGTPVGLEDCPSGWTDDGLTCREPIHWNGCKNKGLLGECYGALEGGNVVGRLNGGGKCPGPGGDEYKDKVDGLCYKTCPKEQPNHMPGMPYLCYPGGELSYGRGAGLVPALFEFFGKYRFP